MKSLSLSFAGEERAYVYEVARHLKAANVRVFYDHYERARLWGRDLAEDLQQLYFDESEYVVMFISRHYVAKIWPGHEKRAALAAALTANREYILPVRFDDTPLPGLNPTVRFEDARATTASELADLTLQKLGRNLDLRKGNAVAPPELPSASGMIEGSARSRVRAQSTGAAGARDCAEAWLNEAADRGSRPMGIEPCRWSGRSGDAGSKERSGEPRSGCWWRPREVD
jgi:hypothetical protein